jgi:hypothetical protein
MLHGQLDRKKSRKMTLNHRVELMRSECNRQSNRFTAARVTPSCDVAA